MPNSRYACRSQRRRNLSPPDIGSVPCFSGALGYASRGPHMGDRITGVFWAAFLLFSWTAASIVSGAVIERIRSFSFWIIAVLIGSVT